MGDQLAILAGSGALPLQLAAAHPDALFVTFSHDTATPDVNPVFRARFEQFGALFQRLRDHRAGELVLAGAMARPALDPNQFDPETTALLPRLMTAMSKGDDGLLREVIAVFEGEGFAVRGAHELEDGLTAEKGLICGPEPDAASLSDAAVARAILQSLAAHDVGQSAVVAAGLCLGVETLQGTDAMLRYVAQTPDKLRRAKGVLLKAPKPDQELRVDMPAIGPGTAKAATAAGLAGIVIDAGRVLILDRAATIAALETAGLFLLAE